MADPIASSQHQEVTMSTSATITTVVSTDTQDEVPTLHLKLKKPKTGRKVQWTTETVDNECMNKKKSKCCCIYKKPKEFGESSSSEEDSDDECDHCKGHVDKKDKHPNATACTPTENGTTVITEGPPPNGNFENPPPSDPPPP